MHAARGEGGRPNACRRRRGGCGLACAPIMALKSLKNTVENGPFQAVILAGKKFLPV